EEFLVRRARARRQRSELDAEQDLAGLERRLEEIDEERVERDAALAEPGPRDDDAIESEQRDRRVLRRVGVREIPAEGRLLADAPRRDRREPRGKPRRMIAARPGPP